jgi:SET domain
MILPCPNQAKGLGAFATRAIPEGSTFFEDQALFVADSACNTDPDILLAFYRLLEDDQKIFLRLARHESSELQGPPGSTKREFWESCSDLAREIYAIHSTNSFLFKRSPDTPQAQTVKTSTTVIFPAVSRFNHSCTPNVFLEMRTEGGKVFGAVTAKRHIQEGEELCICYVNSETVGSERRGILRDFYGIVCFCLLCSRF